jgi:ABC-type dipeptide/oligopeptide/nickel transport system permease subunit
MGKDGYSFGREVWSRFRRDRTAMAGLIVIAASVLIAFLAYWMAPDHSPMANRMMVELAGRKPGHRQSFLSMPKANAPEGVGWLERTLNGQKDAFDLVPIVSSGRKGDSLVYEQFLDDGVTERKSMLVKGEPQVRNLRFWLGTDKYGRDILSRLLIGTRVSLSVGLVAVAISLLIGILLGSLAGYFRGRVDDAVMWLINVVWSIPTLLLVFAITLALGKGFWQVFIAVGLTLWVNVARIIRGQVMGIRELEYVEATRALGFSHARTIIRHILPNVLGPVLVVAASNFAVAIVMEAGLSFLGVGVQPPQPSWGLMIKENYNFIITHNPMLAIVPGLAIMTLVLAFNTVGNGLRDAMDVRQG